MPHVTQVLGNEVGIQYQGVQDKSSRTGEYPVVGLFIGYFRRGRFDKPMTIHKGNIKAILGYDPKNPDYAAVSDALDSGLPSVQVVRLPQVDYAYLTLGPYFNNAKVKINGRIVFDGWEEEYSLRTLIETLYDHGIACYNSFDSYGSWPLYRFQNISDQSLKVEFIDTYEHVWGMDYLRDQPNNSIKAQDTSDLMEGFKHISFELSANMQNYSMYPTDVFGWAYNYLSEIYLEKNIDDETPFIYKIFVNDQPLINPNNNTVSFDLINDGNALMVSLYQAGIDLEYYNFSNDYSIQFQPNEKPQKIKIIREGYSEYERFFVEDIPYTYENDVLTQEFYLFDPINLWN